MTAQRVPVLCLPHAGAGASFFRKWTAPAGVELVPLQPPGREERTDEEPHRDVISAVHALLPDAALPGPGVALFGHSLGAVLAYELARALEERTEVPVAHVFVSGSPGPNHGRAHRSEGLSDTEFLVRVEELAGYRHEAFDSPEFRDLLLPTLRADVAMHEAYRPPADEPIDAPITCLRGDSDALVPESDARRWRSATRGRFTYTTVPGGHMYLADSPERVLEVIAATLAPARSTCG